MSACKRCAHAQIQIVAAVLLVCGQLQSLAVALVQGVSLQRHVHGRVWQVRIAALKREEEATAREAEHLEAEKLRHLR